MKVIGLTGTSGSGKSTVSEILMKMGAYVIDCDEIAHYNMSVGEIAYNDIVENFGKEILLSDGSINRKALGNIVFSNKEKLALLNSITHKHIVNCVKKIVSQIKSDPKEYTSIVIDAPLLKEAGLTDITDCVWVVDAPVKKRLERIMKRDNTDEASALKRFANQTGSLDIADLVIQNDFDNLKELENYVLGVYASLIKE